MELESQSCQSIADDLMEMEPRKIVKILPLYNERQSFKKKLIALKEALRGSLIGQQRISSLAYAYQIGTLLKGSNNPKRVWEGLRRETSAHYYKGIKRTFLLFRHDERQIYRMKKTTLSLIKTLKTRE